MIFKKYTVKPFFSQAFKKKVFFRLFDPCQKFLHCSILRKISFSVFDKKNVFKLLRKKLFFVEKRYLGLFEVKNSQFFNPFLTVRANTLLRILQNKSVESTKKILESKVL
jgi:hypothetical protein